MSEQLTPEWHDLTKYPAPEWAKYRAQDSSGYVCDFQYLPNVASSNWLSDEGELSGLDEDFERNPRWKDTLVTIDELRAKQKPKQDQSTDSNLSQANNAIENNVLGNVDDTNVADSQANSENVYPAENSDQLDEKLDIPPPQYDPKDVAFQPKHAHYFKQWGSELIDIYAVLDMFDVKDQAIGHAIKKLLMGGNRGYKDTLKDWNEAIDSINRAIQIKKFKEGTDSGK